MRVPALADAVTHLPGLAPCAASLVALARAPASAWDQIRYDPGGVLLLMSSAPTVGFGSKQPIATSVPADPCIFDEAIRLVDRAPFIDWSDPTAALVYQPSLSHARLASFIAERSGCCDPEEAWVAGLLAGLGWFAVCAVSMDAVRACLEDPEWKEAGLAVQRRHWGTDHAAIARRLNRRWRLPAWLSTVTGHLDLRADDAIALGAKPGLFRAVQLSVGLFQQERSGGLNLAVGATPAESAAVLGITGDWDEFKTKSERIVLEPLPSIPWDAPGNVALLRDLLTQTGEIRRLTENMALHDLEKEVDQLHRALSAHRGGEEQRLQELKLTALAEFAAGAGHEINNPLAVISGQAQYLLSDETDSAKQRSLQTIINQTHRISGILTALMQFARPARPQKQLVDLPLLVREVTAELSDLAEQRRVRLTCALPDHSVQSYADPRQLHLALACLVRNAIEAAPPEGWAGIRLENSTTDRVDLVVEDSGTGPNRMQREHLFDPFYSGRSAGRGRGLGLPTAWRLAREHGGNVRFEDLPQGPTRFVLSLPRNMESSTELNGQRCA